MCCDTVAKLLHEWSQPERSPGQRWRLPWGTTVIVDEASMLGTPSLDHLIELAAANAWRLALIGDPRQLQAVGRGGMFAELCATGRTIEIERVHRFEQPWEAHASLLLRQGDPRALDLYKQHGRIRAGTSTSTSTTSPTDGSSITPTAKRPRSWPPPISRSI